MFKQLLSKSSTWQTGTRAFKYTHAITRQLPNSFVGQAVRRDASQQISLTRAKQQLKNYEEILKRCGVKVVSLPADEKYPDSVFIEDAAVVIGQKACVTRPGHSTRVREVEAVRNCLCSLGFEIQELDDPAAIIDGGDVLFTGEEIFVGESNRTNKAGIDSLQRVFPDIPVMAIPVMGALHLKCVASLAQDGVILVGGSVDAPNILKVLHEKARGQYHIVELAEEKSANVVFVNGHTIIKTEKELGSDFKKLTAALTVPWIDTEFDELLKADGSLTCCSICVQAPRESS